MSNVLNLRVDLSDFAGHPDLFDKLREEHQELRVAILVCRITMRREDLTAEVLFNGKSLASHTKRLAQSNAVVNQSESSLRSSF